MASGQAKPNLEEVSSAHTGVSFNVNSAKGGIVNTPILTGNTIIGSVTINYSPAGHEPQRITETSEKQEWEFVKRHRDQLIQKVSSVMAIADGLRTRDMISDELYCKVCSEVLRQNQMRLLFEVFDCGADVVKAEFCRLLEEKERYLVEELKSGASKRHR